MATEPAEAKTLRDTPRLFWGLYVVFPLASLIACVTVILRWDVIQGLDPDAESLPVAAVAALLLGSFGVLFLWHGLVAIYHVHLKGPKPRRRPSGRSTGDAVVGSLRSEEGQPQAEIAPTHEGAAPATGFNAWLREHEPAMTFVSWATGIVLFALAVLDRF